MDPYVNNEFRKYILKLIDEDLVNVKRLAKSLLGWLSEDDCEQHIRDYDLMWAGCADDDDDDDEEEEEDVIV